MNIWDEIIKAGELQKLKKEAKADIIPVLKVLLDTDTVRMKDVIELCEAHGVTVDATLISTESTYSICTSFRVALTFNATNVVPTLEL